MLTRQKRTRELTQEQIVKKQQKNREYELAVQKLSNDRYRDKIMPESEYKKRKSQLWEAYSKWALEAGIWEVIEG